MSTVVYDSKRIGILFLIVFGVWLSFFISMSNPERLLTGYWYFFFIGLLGAIVANSTGSGGGIIFIPFFDSLGFTNVQALGTSILIQCFGMTSGSISWLYTMLTSEQKSYKHLKLIKELLILGGCATILGVVCAQYIIPEPDISMVFLFRGFSIIFGACLLYSVFRRKVGMKTRHGLSTNDRVSVFIICFAGAMLVAWISIGVGEWIALYLIFRHFPTMISICIGVCMSSIAVLVASIYHIGVVSSVVWEVLLFAAPAAVIGGAIAKFLALRLGPARLKVFFGTWILVTGLIM